MMQMEGVDAKQLSALHGELIAFDWIEQNTGQASPMKDGVIANCYRITPNGLREYGRFHGIKIEEKVLETPEKKKFPRKKKERTDLPEAAVVVASERSPEMPEMTNPMEQKQESDSLEAPVVAASEESPEMTEMPEKKIPKSPRKKKQKSDSSEVGVVVASEESLLPAA